MQDAEGSVGPLVSTLNISETPLECAVGYCNFSVRGRAVSLKVAVVDFWVVPPSSLNSKYNIDL